MSRREFYNRLADDRSSLLSTDAALRAVGRAYRQGAIKATEAIEQLRALGACEPEIAEALS